MSQTHIIKRLIVPPFKYDCEPRMRPFIEHLLEGEYDIPYVDTSGDVQTVLDLGGNIGAYTYWASYRWPGATIHAFEPMPDNCTAFLKHLSQSGVPAWRYKLIQAAVSTTASPTITMYKSKINCGMHSVRPGLAGEGATEIKVPVYSPKDLPECDVLKVDTEGCEVEILTAYLATHQPPKLLSYEYHSDADRIELEKLISPSYLMCTGSILYPNLGTLNWIHKSLVHFKEPEAVA